MSRAQVEKILKIALDPSAGDGEAENAAKMAVRVARKSGLRFDDLFPTTTIIQEGPQYPMSPPPSCDILMPYGKHKGRTLGDIAQQNPGYLNWWLANCDPRPGLTDAMEVVLAYYQQETA